ncbi:MAG TPA: hypothetical protein VMM35_12525, partial [Longimicrobiales bacterium]|nr:hypothetical protein [Longimicrobiales bacterium]
MEIVAAAYRDAGGLELLNDPESLGEAPVFGIPEVEVVDTDLLAEVERISDRGGGATQDDRIAVPHEVPTDGVARRRAVVQPR